MQSELRGRRVTVMGLGHFGGGAGAARWLARQGARVTVTDLADESAMADARAALADAPIDAWHLGGHQEEDFGKAELVVVNPAVRPGNRWLEIARASGAELLTEIELFMNRCPGRIVGVTGSNGKSTTAAMTAAILRGSGRRTWLGGNLGGSLLDELEAMTADDWAVLEISSFQLWHLSAAARMPEVAIVTNCTPNHLDWHGSFAEYVAAKQRIITAQPRDGVSVLNTQDAEVGRWAPLVRGRLTPLVPEKKLPQLSIPGPHYRQDAQLAATAARAIGCNDEQLAVALGRFTGLAQRLEMVAVIGGRRFYNDSSATTPESTMAALEALDGPVWLLAGGSDKGSDFAALAGEIACRARGAAFFGAVGERLERATRAAVGACVSTRTETLDEALAWSWRHSRPGETILLSPACASRDQYVNYRQRGAHFIELLRALARVPPR